MSEHRRFLELAAAALDFELSPTERDELARHLHACPACARTAAAMRADARMVGSLPMRALAVDRAPIILSGALRQRPGMNPRRLAVLISLVALVGLALVTVGNELLQRTPPVEPPPSSPPSSPDSSRTARPLAWVAGAPLAVARQGHTATLLPDGRVLVAGGLGIGNLHSSEIWDPATGLWSAGHDMRDARSQHAAIDFFGEEVIVFGGYGQSGEVTAGIESYAGDAWVDNRLFLVDARANVALAMAEGRGVMIIGGHDVAGSPLASVEILDLDRIPEVRPAPPMLTARGGATATQLFGSFGIVVAGGIGADGLPLADAEMFDHAAGRWTAIAPMREARAGHTAHRLNDNRILVAGGLGADGRTLATSELYDPETDTWTVVPMVEARESHAGTMFSGSTVLVIGGRRDGIPLASTEIFDPIVGTWSAGPSLLLARVAVAVRLRDGSVMVVGGEANGSALREIEILNPFARP